MNRDGTSTDTQCEYGHIGTHSRAEEKSNLAFETNQWINGIYKYWYRREHAIHIGIDHIGLANQPGTTPPKYGIIIIGEELRSKTTQPRPRIATKLCTSYRRQQTNQPNKLIRDGNSSLATTALQTYGIWRLKIELRPSGIQPAPNQIKWYYTRRAAVTVWIFCS